MALSTVEIEKSTNGAYLLTLVCWLSFVCSSNNSNSYDWDLTTYELIEDDSSNDEDVQLLFPSS